MSERQVTLAWDGYAPLKNGGESVMLSCCRDLAWEVRVAVGEMFNRADWKAGWKIALKDGWRVHRVVVASGGVL